jgi:hypothetical protein
VGDVLLVHDEAAIEENFSLFGYYNIVGSEIVTENGVYLGKVSLRFWPSGSEFTFHLAAQK